MSDNDSSNLIIEEFIKYKKILSEQSPGNKSTTVFDKALSNADVRSIQLISRDIDTADLATALAGACGIVRSKFFDNMGSRGGAILYQDILHYQKLTEKEINAAQERVLEYYESLKNR